ncbi:hypothetical protein CEXT_280171 [Caerostris extrusa]|uniref:Uncharacterized protein n=1 Tax=Caerostris extrusa TaxID=172846 RepID=A0AAV4XQI2_CAEEX|nr:hypothetical protein CEXT_280171 [Caerostris extrusa]
MLSYVRRFYPRHFSPLPCLPLPGDGRDLKREEGHSKLIFKQMLQFPKRLLEVLEIDTSIKRNDQRLFQTKSGMMTFVWRRHLCYILVMVMCERSLTEKCDAFFLLRRFSIADKRKSKPRLSSIKNSL